MKKIVAMSLLAGSFAFAQSGLTGGEPMVLTRKQLKRSVRVALQLVSEARFPMIHGPSLAVARSLSMESMACSVKMTEA